MRKRIDMSQRGMNIRKWSAEKISHVVLLSIVGISAVVFLLFYCVGYNMPSMWNENVNSPLFTDLVMVLMIVLFLAAVVIAVYSKISSMRKNHADAIVNGINGKRITRLVSFGVIVVMALSYLPSPSDDVIVNGKLYDDALWLRLTNMFVVTSILLIVFGVVIICFASIVNRRIRK